MRHKNRTRLKIRLLAVTVLAVLLLVLLYQGGRWLEKRSEKPEARGNYQQRYEYEDGIEVDGGSYRRRRDATSILLMGIDRASDAVVTGHRNGGQADFLQLLVIDSSGKRVTRVQIDRDTMTPITILGVLGNRSGVRTSQICLSHGFGDGKAQSCELTVDAVSNLLLGAPVDYYVAMNLDSIPALNDAVGGVTVTLEDDFSALDASMTRGKTMTLMGEQAEFFVRSRRSIGVGTNEARMTRQRQYIDQLMRRIDGQIQEDQAFIGSLYDKLEPYLITDMSRGTLINQVWNSRAYGREFVELEGSYQIGSDGFMQFYADETALKRLVLELFYQALE